ncbi:MAG: transporter [Betaproteobacteria bacterium]|nr:transporter [Betaproteobacteria bacterium]
MNAPLMKVSSFRAVALGTILASSLIFNAAAYAAEEVVTQVQIPATSADIWRSIDKETAILDTLIRTGKFGELHHHAFAIRDLVKALPSRSGTLPAEKMAQIKTSSKYVATLAERLDAAGDANDKAASESNLRKLKGLLNVIRAN